MSTAIPTPPNTIIAALLDIASVAYAVAHSGKVGPSAYAAVDADDLDKLETSLAVLELLPQIEVDGHLTGPARARKHLESFLEGGDVIDLIEKRTRAFPKMTITLAGTPEQQEALKDMLREHRSQPLMAVAAADTQVGCIEFEPQEWKAPTTGPGFTPTREFPASGPISHDFYTHRNSWRDIIVKCIEHTKAGRVFDESLDRMGIDADTSYLEHELRAFDRAFDSLPPALKPQANAVSGETERRMRPRFVEPMVPLTQASMVEQQNRIEFTRPAFERAMQALKHGVKRHETGLYFGMTEYRWEGWEAAMASMTSEIRTNMLADTADEALRIINDAGLLKNLVELFTMRDPGTSVTIREQIPHLYEDFKWKLDIMPRGDRAARTYESTSLHQVIVVAHKGEQDHEYPEPEMCAYCGMSFETPCDAPPTGPCEQANNAFHGSDPTKPRPPAPANRRNEMIALLVRVKDELGVPAAKNIIRAYAPPPGIMADIPDQYIEAVIAACEEGLKQE